MEGRSRRRCRLRQARAHLWRFRQGSCGWAMPPGRFRSSGNCRVARSRPSECLLDGHGDRDRMPLPARTSTPGVGDHGRPEVRPRRLRVRLGARLRRTWAITLRKHGIPTAGRKRAAASWTGSCSSPLKPSFRTCRRLRADAASGRRRPGGHGKGTGASIRNAGTTGRFPGYPEIVQELDIPGWAYRGNQTNRLLTSLNNQQFKRRFMTDDLATRPKLNARQQLVVQTEERNPEHGIRS